MVKTTLAVLLTLWVSSSGIKAEDWITTDGKTYKNVTVVKVDLDTVTILDADGGAKVDLVKLPADIQKRLNYDPAKAQAYESTAKQSDADAVSQKAALKAMEAHMSHQWVKITQVLPDGVLVTVPDEMSVAKSPLSYIAMNSQGLVDGQELTLDLFEIGTFSYTNTRGAKATVIRYTTSKKDAAVYYLLQQSGSTASAN